jgi:uncharacterized membrane protein YccC
MDRKQLVIQTLAKAKKYQELARWIGDRETVHRIQDLVAKLKRRAQVVAKPSQNRIRRRARQIWQENGCPSGRDEEFWLQAERELRETEELARRTVDGR